MSEFPAIPLETRLAQRKATDPKTSAWVSANAGSGKTFILARRVMRLLLDGTEPSRILCLTFTKAAAAEMSNRIFAELGKWATIPEAGLVKALADILDRPPARAEIGRARTLFAVSLDSPGGLKIQTIHAFCEALLHQFPFEANIAGSFEVIDEARQQELIAEARRQVILELESDGHGAAASTGLRAAFAELLELATDTQIETAISQIIAARDSFKRWTNGDVDGAMAPLWKDHGFLPGVSEAAMLSAAMAHSPISAIQMREIITKAGASKSPTDQGTALLLQSLLHGTDLFERFNLLRQIFLKQKDLEPKANRSILTQAVTNAIPGLAELLETEKEWTRDLARRHESWRILRSSRLVFTLGEAIIERYLRLKRRGGFADFDDLVTHAGHLLARPDVGPWIQYKLDRGIDHVLVDEAQDTNRRQWAIIDALVAEFFAGEGQVGRTRTQFAVGDAKQSIFSFQGADPRLFGAQANRLKRLAEGARLAFEGVRLDLSFRSTPDILEAVDTVFDLADNFRGLSSDDDDDGTQHEAIRRSDPGEVWIWPLVGREKPEKRTSWLEPLDHRGPDHPADILAARIAETIKEWIDRGETLPGRDAPIRYGDILILVRKRDYFSTAVVRRLKEAGLKIAGADRLSLTEHIAVEDLMALGRFMLMAEDDLSLAAVLKSPLFGFDDDDLIALTQDRGKGCLSDHLVKLATDAGAVSLPAPLLAKLKSANDRIERLMKLAGRLSPYQFFSRVLGAEGGRRAFVSRLGTEAGDVLDAFEQAALDHSTRDGAGLEGFLASLLRSAPEVKREIDMRSDEIRVITVHSAKGLEAPIVFLVDPCTPAFSRRHLPALVRLGEPGEAEGFLWANGDRKAMEPILRHDAEAERKAEEEYRRLLYVGMTRAADRLVVCGWYNLTEPNPPYWHSMVGSALGSAAELVDTGTGWLFHKWRSSKAEVVAARRIRPTRPAAESRSGPTALPAWLSEVPLPETRMQSGISPSRAAETSKRPSEQDAMLVFADGGAASDAQRLQRTARDRGMLTHLLLQHLPAVEPMQRQETARWIVARQAGSIAQTEAYAAVDEVFRLLADPAHAELFGPSSRAEIRVAGNVMIRGTEVAVSGQIDRIAVSKGKVVIADFKTNRDVPAEAAAAPPAYILQLALYRELLRQIYPGREVHCFLLWTRYGRSMRVDDAMMDRALAEMTLS